MKCPYCFSEDTAPTAATGQRQCQRCAGYFYPADAEDDDDSAAGFDDGILPAKYDELADEFDDDIRFIGERFTPGDDPG